MYAHSLFARVLLVTGLFAATSFTQARAAAAPSAPDSSPVRNAQVAQQYAQLPFSFEAIQGQAGARTKFLSRGNGYGIDLTGDAAVLSLCRAAQGTAGRNAASIGGRLRRPVTCEAIRMRLEGASLTAAPIGEEKLPGTINYFIGNEPAHWRTGIPTFAKVRYKGVYPGIDLVYYGSQRQLEYDFVAAPGADPRTIQLRFDPATKVRRTPSGDLVVSAASAGFTFRKPAIYQVVDGRRISIAGEFVLAGAHAVRFRVGHYDRNKPLVIDPVLVYSTFLSGSGDAADALIGDAAEAIAIDSLGNVYVTGETVSTDFPVTQGAFQTTYPGAASPITPTVFVSKLNAAGTAQVYSTYLGGNGGDQGSAIAVDAAGDAYVAGQTGSQNFPVTAGAFQTVNKSNVGSEITAFVAALNPAGTALVYSTYLGGSIIDGAEAIAVDASGNAYVAGQTSSTDFPVTPGAYQTANKSVTSLASNAFVAKLNSGGTALIYSTYLGGSGGTRMGQGGCVSAAAAPNDILGWPVGNNEDGAYAIAVDAAGDVYVAGQALSTDFPVTQGALQTQSNGAKTNATNAFVAKLNPSGSALLYSTYLGGSGTQCIGGGAAGYNGDAALALAVDSSGDAYLAGVTFSKDFPVTQGALQTTNQFSYKGGPGPTAFVAKLNPPGSALVYSTYLGGSGGFINVTPFFAQYGGDQATGLAVDSYGDVYVTGGTASLNFPVTAGAYQTANAGATGSGGSLYNAFVAELNPAGSALLYSTYLGGNGSNPNVESNEHIVPIGDLANALALDGSGNVYIAGQAESANFPITHGAFQAAIPAASSAFITKLAVPPGFIIAGTSVTVTAGATTGNTSTITVTPTGGFSGSVTLTAAITSEPSGALNPPTFSFGSTSPVTITGTSAATATMTIATAAAGGCSASNRNTQEFPWSIPGGATLAVLVLIAVPRRSRWNRWLALVLLVAGLAAGLSACGSGSTGTCTAITPPTTAGVYTITVTGASGTTTATGAVTLTVQ
jgi:hypothetical protein